VAVVTTGRSSLIHALPLASGVDVAIALLVFALPAMLVWVWAFVDAARNPELSTGQRVAWLAAVALLPGVGALVYIAVPGRRRLRLGG
jgi:hypothetical protein